MWKFTLARSAQGLLVFVVATFVAYSSFFVLGDPFASTGDKVVPPETQALLREKFGLGHSLPVQFLTYLGNLFTGDLGVDYNQRRPVWDQLAAVTPNTVRLAVAALALQLLIGISLGVLAAVRRSSLWDVLVTTGTVVMFSLPLFVVAVFFRNTLSGLQVFGLTVFPVLPRTVTVRVEWWQELLLPTLTLALGALAFTARLTRASMLEVLESDYVRTARAKGLGEGTVLFKHALRNAVIPLTNLAAIDLGALMAGTIIVETIFQYDGLGYLFVRALRELNSPILMAVLAYSIIVFIVLIALADILCAYLDPRLRID